MHLNQERIYLLVQKMFDGSISIEEKNELDSYINQVMGSERLEISRSIYPNEEYLRNKLLNNILKQTIPENRWQDKLLHFISKYAIAGAIILVFSISIFLLYNKNTNSYHELSANLKFEEVYPAPSKAILRDKFGNALNLAQEHGNITIKDRKILYTEKDSVDFPFDKNKNQMLTLETSKGGFYSLKLSDGSNVWLNANSKLEYPIEFDSKRREVILDGEAYFQVVKDREKPFYVKTKNQTVRVIGTEFNIKSYNNANSTITSLVEGSIALKLHVGSGTENILLPNEQAVNSNNQLQILQKDLQPDIAWRKGLFYFNGIEAKNALIDISNWYDIDIEFRSSLKDVKFYGVIERKKPLSTILYLMEESGLHLKIEKTHNKMKLIAY